MTNDDSNKLKDMEKELGKTIIDGIIKNSDFNKGIFQAKKELPIRWVIIPVPLYFLVCALFLWLSLPPKPYIFLFIVGLLPIVWLTCSIHIRFDSKTVTGIAGLVAFLGLVLAAGLVNPPELVEKVDKYFDKPADAKSKSN